jgi:hypothetical protein
MRAARWLAKDESGMTMGLAVIMIVLIGVMGGGLLTFVQRDLNAVVEVNKGQKAFELADAGVQLARQHIKRDPRPAHYDLDDILSPAYNVVCDILGSNPLAVDETLDILPGGTPYVDGNWSPGGGGVSKSNLDGVPSTDDSLIVKIQWLNPGAGPTAGCKAPVASPPEEHYFYRVTSIGYYHGAKRQIEAIYETYPIGVPEAFFTTDDVMINGNTKVYNTSVFSTYTGESKTTGIVTFEGVDKAYQNWAPPLCPKCSNPTPRLSVTPGFGTVGNITGLGEVPGRDYDRYSSPNNFVMPNERDGLEMTFPFDPGKQPDLEELKMEAMRQEAENDPNGTIEDPTGNYREIDNPTGTTSLSDWPADVPGTTTVVYYKFTGGSSTLRWDVDGKPDTVISDPSDPIITLDDCTGPLRRGIVIVENGNFSTQPNKDLFRGIIIVRQGDFVDDVDEGGEYSDTGTKTCVEGYANADGRITLGGNVSSGDVFNIIDPTETAGFFRVRLWSWRECYSTTCT